MEKLHAALLEAKRFAFDFETTGLSPHHGARVFSMSIVWRDPGTKLLCSHFAYKLPELDLNPYRAIFEDERLIGGAHNAKFEGAFLLAADIKPKLRLWCTEVMERLRRNDHMSYSLEECGKRIGFPKDDTVKKYMDTHKLFRMVKKGNKNVKDYFFSQVPEDLIRTYNIRDSEVSLMLMEKQAEVFREWDESSTPIRNVVRLELETTKNLLEMEWRGVRVDVPYCQRALSYELNRAEVAKRNFEQYSGVPFVDSRKTLQPIFDRFCLPYGETEKGNPSFSDEALPRVDSPLVEAIREYRNAYKRAETYFRNFLKLVSPDGRIHPNIRQGGTRSGRFSCADPNVQNWPDDEKNPNPFPIRRAFIADEGSSIVSIDYAQMEYRVHVDDAEQLDLIQRIQDGLDFHEATAKLMSVDRKLAKRLNFALVYGAGAQRLADELGVTLGEATRLRNKYFDALQMVAAYNGRLTQYAKGAPFCYNWMGRRFYFDRLYAYKYPNYRTQGGCADIFRIALQSCNKLLRGTRSFAILPIHDELVFSIHNEERHLIPLLKEAMISAYISRKHLDLDASVSIGENFADLEDYHGDEAGNEVRSESHNGLEQAPQHLGQEVSGSGP